MRDCKEIITDDRLREEIENHPHLLAYRDWKGRFPNVFQMFRDKALELLNHKKRFGIRLLSNQIRWYMHFNYESESFKISNNYTALIIRELMLEIPQLREYCPIKRTASIKTRVDRTGQMYFA